MTQQQQNFDWLSAFVQVGTLAGEAWSPVGAGFLFLDAETVWLITSRTALEEAKGEVAAWVGNPGTVVGISQVLKSNNLDWVVHGEHNLAACLFPLDPAWNVKAFSEGACVPASELAPLLSLCSLGSPYGFNMGGRPPTMALDGVLSALDPEQGRIFTTAPLLPKNEGAPLLLITAPPSLGGQVVLAGVMAQTLPIRVPPATGMVPPNLIPTQLHLSVAHPISDAIALIRSEAAVAQRERVKPPATQTEA